MSKSRERRGRRRPYRRKEDLSLWLDENQVKMFSGKELVDIYFLNSFLHILLSTTLTLYKGAEVVWMLVKKVS